MRKVLIMHGRTKREIMSLDRSRHAHHVDWQFYLICANGGLNEERWVMEEEGEDKEQERLVAMVSHCLCPINRSITIVFTTSSLHALGFSVSCAMWLWVFVYILVCSRLCVDAYTYNVSALEKKDQDFNQCSFSTSDLITSLCVFTFVCVCVCLSN